MAGSALLRRGLVEQDRLAVHSPVELMAILALYVLVHALEREAGTSIMVKKRRAPLRAVVAFCASRHRGFGELLPVNVLMTLLAPARSGLEVNVCEIDLHVGRLVTIHACSCPVCSQQRERSLRVIELRQLLPRLGGMACLAAAGAAVSLRFPHPLIELTAVGIGVATRAPQVGPVVRDGGRLEFCRLLVAVRAWHGNVLPS